MCAKVRNTLKSFGFAIEIPGRGNQFLVQKATLPEKEIEEVTHGGANTLEKTPGMVTIGDLVLENLIVSDGSDNWAWNLFKAAQDELVGGGVLRQGYIFECILRELGPDGITTVGAWEFGEVWVKKISHGDFDRATSDNMIQTVTLSVSRMQKFI